MQYKYIMSKFTDPEYKIVRYKYLEDGNNKLYLLGPHMPEMGGNNSAIYSVYNVKTEKNKTRKDQQRRFM